MNTVIIIFRNIYSVYVNAKKPPQGILLLGGDVERERYLVELTRKINDNNLDLWVSSGCWRPNHPAFDHLLSQSSPFRLHVDSRAIDTVTNYTTLISDIKTAKISHLYLLTSAYHMPRALQIGKIIYSLGYGIALSPISPPSSDQEGKGSQEESTLRILRDCFRAVLFLLTGLDCAFLSKIRHPRRWKRSKELMKIPAS